MRGNAQATMLCGTVSQGARTPTQHIVQSILRKEAQQGKEKTSEQQEQKQQKSTFFLFAHAHSLHIYAYIVQITMFGKYASKKKKYNDWRAVCGGKGTSTSHPKGVHGCVDEVQSTIIHIIYTDTTA